MFDLRFIYGSQPQICEIVSTDIVTVPPVEKVMILSVSMVSSLVI